MDDINGDGLPELAVGAAWDDDGPSGSNRGAVWILFLQLNGTVEAHQKISATQGGFTGHLDAGDEFGSAVACLGDVNGDGVPDLAIGAALDDDGGSLNSNGSVGYNRGAVWVLFLRPNGTVGGYQKISDTQGGFNGSLDDDDSFGSAVAVLGNIGDPDAISVVVGAVGSEQYAGAVHVLELRAAAPSPSPTASSSPSASPSPFATPSPSVTSSATPTASATSTSSATPTASPTITVSATASPSQEVRLSPSQVPSPAVSSHNGQMPFRPDTFG